MSLFEDDLDDVGDAMRGAARGIETGGNAIVRGLQTLATGVLGGAAGGFLTSPLVLGLGVLTIGVGAAASALKSFTDEATKYGRVMASLRASQGLSFNKSFELAGNNQILGISPTTTSQMFASQSMNPLVAGIRANVFGGASPYDPNGIAKNAVWYQKMASQGVFGRQMANSRLDALYGGKAPDEVRLAMNQRPGLIAGNLAYAANMRKGLGITGEMQRSYVEDIPMAKARVGYAFSMAKVRLAVELAPLLERSLTSFATLLANNAPRIAQGIQTIGKFLVQDFPPMLMRGGAAIARGLGGALLGFGAFAKGMVGNVRPMLGTLDLILNGLRKFAGVAAGIAGMIVQGVGALWAGIQKTGIPKFLGWAASKATGIPNDTPENRLANGIIGGTAAKIALPVAAAGVLGAGWRLLTGGGGGAGGAGGAGGPSLISRLMSGLSTAGGWVGSGLSAASGFLGSTSVGTLGSASVAGMGAAFGATPLGLGLVGGVAGYEGLRTLGNKIGGPVAGFPSTFQMGRYGYERLRGNSQNDAALYALGRGDQTVAAKRQSAIERGLQAQAQGGLLGPLGYVPGRTPGDAFSQNQNAALRAMSVSNLMGTRIPGISEMMFGKVGDAATAGGNRLMGFGDSLDKMAGNYSSEIEQHLKTIAETSKANADSSKQIEANTGKGAKSGADLLDNFPDMMKQLIALTSAYIAQDAANSFLVS